MRLSKTKLMITYNITILQIFSQAFGYQALKDFADGRQ